MEERSASLGVPFKSILHLYELFRCEEVQLFATR